jgi:hypothetical protein
MPNQSQPTATLQGVVVPKSAVNPKEFFRGTRRQMVLQKLLGNWQGLGSTDVVDTLRSGILAGYRIHIVGSFTTVLSTGSINSTMQWPYGIVRAVRFQANGQSNLISANGWHLRCREVARASEFDDRGITQYVGGAYPGNAKSQGTLALAAESWGVGAGVTGISAGTYNFDLSVYVPVAYETKTLLGAVFCQTQSTTLELNIDWANLSDLFTVTAPATLTFNTVTVTIEAEMYTVPADGNGSFYLPDLSSFHSYVQNKAPNGVTQGNNEITLAGQGVGRQLMGIFWRTMNGSVPAPVIPTAANVTAPYWRYGTSNTPETFQDGQTLRYENERAYNTDVAAVAGFQIIDFDKEFGFRDAVDEGSATELRFGYTLTSNVTPNGAWCEYSQDVVLAGAAA